MLSFWRGFFVVVLVVVYCINIFHVTVPGTLNASRYNISCTVKLLIFDSEARGWVRSVGNFSCAESTEWNANLHGKLYPYGLDHPFHSVKAVIK